MKQSSEWVLAASVTFVLLILAALFGKERPYSLQPQVQKIQSQVETARIRMEHIYIEAKKH